MSFEGGAAMILKKVTVEQATEFFRRFNQGEFPHQRVGQAFVNNHKLVEIGPCSRSACDAQWANWYNSSTRQYYCAMCSHRINRACNQELCTPQFPPTNELFQMDNAVAAKEIWENWVDLEAPC